MGFINGKDAVMKKYILYWAATVCLFLLSAPAHAATISTVSGFVTIGGPSYIAGNINFDALPVYGLSSLTTQFVDIPTSDKLAEGKLLTSLAGITDASDPVASKPVGTVGTNFLAIYSSIDHPGSATFKFDNAPSRVSFNIGSLDSDNSLTVIDTHGDRYTLTGTQLLMAAASDGTVSSTASGRSTVFVSLQSLSGIAEIILSASKASVMEISNMAAVPLPGAIVLFGSALVGIKRLRRKIEK